MQISSTTTANHPILSEMGSLHLAAISVPYRFNCTARTPETLKASNHLGFRKGRIRAVSTAPDTKSDSGELEEEPPAVNLAFVHSVLLPDGTPDVQFRRTCGGQKLRDIMLDSNIELYGPHARPLLNCAGGGTCGTCMVEVVQGNELLNPRTDKEKGKLEKKPKNWRLACQTTVGKPDSRGLVVIQQLPEWKAHEWRYERLPLTKDSQVS